MGLALAQTVYGNCVRGVRVPFAAVIVLAVGVSPSMASSSSQPQTVRNDGSRTLRKTEGGVQWALRGRSLNVTVRQSAPASVRRRLLGRRLIVACNAEARIVSEFRNTYTAARFSRSVGQRTRITLPRHLRRVTSCAVEAPGRPDDVASVRFAPRPPARQLP